MTDVIIRRGTEADAEGIAFVHTAAWKWAYAGLIPQHYLDGLEPEPRVALWARLASDADEVAPYVAELDGTIVGFVHMGASRDTDDGAASGEVTSLYILESVLGTGVGSRLWHAALEWLREAGHDSVSVWALATNELGLNFYERMGLTRDIEKVDEIRGFELPHLRLIGPIPS